MQIKSKQRETTNKRNCEGTRGGGEGGDSVQSAVGTFRSPTLLTGLLLSFIYTHRFQVKLPWYNTDLEFTSLWSQEPGEVDCSSVPPQKKHNKKAKIHHKHTVDEVLEELRYKNQSILFTWLLLSSDKHLGIVGLWGCIAHSCIVLTARLENSCFVVVFSLSFFFLNHQKSLPAASVWICAHVCWREITGKLLPNQQQMYSS